MVVIVTISCACNVIMVHSSVNFEVSERVLVLVMVMYFHLLSFTFIFHFSLITGMLVMYWSVKNS